ncbi:MAG: squalene/phytoene synthase family protein [bacterium]
MSLKESSPRPLTLTVLDTYAFEVLLKRVARSFQLSLRILPASLRPTLTLAYMLARASDTIADATSAPDFQRLALLKGLPDLFPEKAPDLGLDGSEKELLLLLPRLLEALQTLPDQGDIIEQWRLILRGQIFDVERFTPSTVGTQRPPLTPVELEEYTYLVAGSVGEFWTRLCFKHVPGYSSKPLEEMLPLARRFGQALQWVNILRDRRVDADAGRIYIPDERFYVEMQRVTGLLESATEYTAAIKPLALRAACVLPLDLANQTLALIAEHPLGVGVKVPRYKVWLAFAKAFWR